MLWQDLRPEDFEEAVKRSKGLCVVPIGCLEKHGQHLPVGTDYYRAYTFAVEAAKVEEAVVFPTGFWLGDVSGYHAQKMDAANNNHGGIGIKIETMLRILEELCDEIARNGFTKILLFHSHGGNITMLKSFLRRQEMKKKPYATLYAWANNNGMNQPEPWLKAVTERREDFPMVTEEDIATMERWKKTGYQGGHANFIETAEILGKYPQLVAQDLYDAEDGLNNHRTDYMTALGIHIYNDWGIRYPNMYSGAAPHGCTEGIGQAMIQISIERAIRVYRMIKNDDTCLEAAKVLCDKQI